MGVYLDLVIIRLSSHGLSKKRKKMTHVFSKTVNKNDISGPKNEKNDSVKE